MGIFTRCKDIVSSNLNAMLDHAEDPEKLIRLMIREMEETLVELKAQCASHMATRQKIRREMDGLARKVDMWGERARLAVDKGRDDLAREALVEKRVLSQQVERLEEEFTASENLVTQAQEDIGKLEEKLVSARDKQRLLVERHSRAMHRKRARTQVRKAETSETYLRFERFEQQVERMEAEAELEGPYHAPHLEEEFRLLEGREDIERELEALKQAKTGGSGQAVSSAPEKE